MPRGGKRPGAGRKQGAATKRTRGIADRLAQTGLTPLEVMLEAMQECSFRTLEAEQLDRLAQQHGFKREGQRNWVRRTADFVQLVNLQRSQWSEERYLNFAMWPLALGEPPTVAESKFHFRTRAESMGARDLEGLFSCADRLSTLDDLRAA